MSRTARKAFLGGARQKQSTQCIISVAFTGMLSLFASTTARADFYIHSWNDENEPERTLRINPEFNYYDSKSNFNPSSTKVTPFGLQNYTRLTTDISGAYGFNSWFTGFARTSWARAQVDHDTLNGNVFGLADQSIGLNARLWESKANPAARGTTIDLQVQLDFPGYGNASALANGTPFLGDNSTDFTAGGFINVPISQDRRFSWLLHGGMGYTYRNNGFSSDVPWKVGLKIQPRSEGFSFDGSAQGILSLRNDINTLNVPPGGLSTTGAGGNYFINAVNPSIVVVEGRLGYQLGSNLGFTASVAQSLWGLAAPNGLSVGVGMQARWGDEGKHNPYTQTPMDYGHANQGFVNYAFEARIVKTNDKLNLVKIDKGTQDGVEVGQVFDIFLIKPDGSVGEAIARAKCTTAKGTEAALTVTEYFEEVWIEEGFIAKRPLQ